jgi:hypothetical protein
MNDDLPGQLISPIRTISRRVLNQKVAAALVLALPGKERQAEGKRRRRKRWQRLRKKCRRMGGTFFKKGTCCNGAARVCIGRCAFPSIQAAILGANAGATISLCPGTYRENITFSRDVQIVGAGADRTILQGTGSTSVVTNFAPRVTLEHLRITGGAADYGAGISNSGDMALNHCAITGNHARIGGGGIVNGVSDRFPERGKLRLSDCTVSGNRVSQDGDRSGSGGGIANADGVVTLINTVVSDNFVGTDDPPGGEGPVIITFISTGGGISNGSGSLTLINSEVRGNVADAGGGIDNINGVVTLDAASRVTGNTARLEPKGGGIHNLAGTVTLASADNVTDNTPNNCTGAAVPLCQG